MKSIRALFFLLLVAALLTTTVPLLLAQTGSTGALTGTVTDPSGAVVTGATVTVTNIGTGAERTATTSSDGAYKFSLLTPGNYKVNFSAPGFKPSEVASVTVNVTETPVLNQKLAISGQVTEVTVEATAETIQTQGVTSGTVVSSQTIKALPLVTRNYTQILSLSPGVVTNVANASAVGAGTQDVNANGARGNQNNYLMDGASVTPYTSGNGAQVGSFAGIPIPNAEAIQEFKVQTSQYDAGYGRNPGANVNVVTRGGSNDFHGDIWEFNRNNFFNANDFFYKRSQIENDLPNEPQTLKQNTFGFDLGGPIVKNKLFFFGSYQGFRQINGVGTSGFASGYQSAVALLPFNDYADLGEACADLRCTNNIPAYRAYLGSVFGPTGSCPAIITSFGAPPNNCNTGFASGVTVAADGSNISNTAIAVLQAQGILNSGYNEGGFYIPSAPEGCINNPAVPSSGCTRAISLPTHANEDQFMVNSDWIISNKHTLTERYLYSRDPQRQSFLCFITPNSCYPGSPEDVTYLSHTGTLKLTSILTNNLVNEARFTFIRNLAHAENPNIVMSCDLPNGATIIPLVNSGQSCPAVPAPYNEFHVIPIIDVLSLYSQSGGWGIGGNFAATSDNITNMFQFGEQVSWNRGMHSLRMGFEGEWNQYNNTLPASGRGELLFLNVADFLTSSSGLAIDGTPPTALTTPTMGCGFFGSSYCAGGATPIALRGLLTHYNRANAFSLFVQDDIRVRRNLTVNAGLRWEYGGWPSDKIGQFTNVWTRQLALVNTGSYYLNDATLPRCTPPGSPVGFVPFPTGTLAGFIVPENYDQTAGFIGPCGSTGVMVNNNNTLFSGRRLHNFAPRLGVAWQPFGNKFVVRAGYGWYYDRAYTTYLVNGMANLPPYSGTVGGAFPASTWNTLHNPYAAVAGTPLTWTPRYLYVGGDGDVNSTGGSITYSNLGYTSNSDDLSRRAPLTQQYSLDLQYDLGHNWVADVGYVGSHATHVFNTGYGINQAHLMDCGVPSPTCNAPTLPQDQAMVVNAAQPLRMPGFTLPYLPFNDPGNATPVLYNTTQNLPARVSYLGYGAGALSTTNAIGDSKYHSLQAQLRHNFSNGLLVLASYTWSKQLTNINSPVSGGAITPPGMVLFGNSASNNPLDLAQQYGLAAFNRSHRFIVSYSYDLPWKGTEGISGKVLGGWTISGITTLQNGQPMTVTGAGGSIYGGGGSRAFLADPVNCRADGVCQSGIPVATTGSTKERALNGWINPSAFATTITASSPYCIGGTSNPGGSPGAPCGTLPNPFLLFLFGPGPPFWAEGATFAGAGTGWGDSPVGILTGPGQWNWDMSIQKNTKVTEWGTLQFRAEFYNIWNHTQFNSPVSTGIGSATFGQIQSTAVTPRVVQFGLKFIF